MKGICGLTNVGNSCYMNAALQILSRMDELNEYLVTVQNVKNKVDSIITSEWVQIYKLFRENHGTILPNRLIDRIKQVSIQKNRHEFSGNDQSDSVEFFEFILDCIHNSLNGIDSTIRLNRRLENPVDKYLDQIEQKEHSIVSTLFTTGYIYRYINPNTNKVEFDRIEHENLISLSIPERDPVSIYDCFMDTFKEELLTGDNEWFDEKENVKKTVLKKSYLCHTPSILVIHLKRWKPNMMKKNIKIQTPMILDIQPFTIHKESCAYELFGIIQHEGSIHGGHYYASIHKNGTWFSIDDHRIETISHEHIIHEGNYCLFYRKIK